MNKRTFLKSGLALGAAAAVPYAPSVFAQSGPGYQTIDPPMNTRVSGKVEVVEFFWFGCPHCFSFEPAINAWKENDKPDYVEFVREAPALNPSWENHSRAFYAAELMGITDEFLEPMFNAIHLEKRKLRSEKQIVKFVDEIGLDGEAFGKNMFQFGVETKLNQSKLMAQAAGLTGVPSVVINGKFLTGASLAGSHQDVIRVINELSASEYELIKAG